MRGGSQTRPVPFFSHGPRAGVGEGESLPSYPASALSRVWSLPLLCRWRLELSLQTPSILATAHLGTCP
jgi:hypothetical protein